MSDVADGYVAVASLATEIAAGGALSSSNAAFLLGTNKPDFPQSQVLIESIIVPTSSYALSYQKRLVDIILSGVMLAAVAPFIIALAIAIKTSSPGPIFFSQQRGGAGGRPFKMIKFRTMFHEIEERPLRQATLHDPRVTKIGRFLRRTSLDELPQLLNVFLGDMSLVGPRPHALAHDHYYGLRIPTYKQRHAVRPGMTGLAQIAGERGETRETADMARRIAFDCDYVRDATFFGDLHLLMATPREMLLSKSAA